MWRKLYLDGEEAFKKGDYATAETKLRAALASPQVPPVKNHGPKYNLGSQQFGFIPEYYLAVICAEKKNWFEALKFANAADLYLENKEEIATLQSIESNANKALNPAAPPPPPAPKPEAGKSTPPPPADPWASVASAIQADLLANKLADAISKRDQARRSNASGDAFNAASLAVDQRDFQNSLATARREMGEGHYSAARQAADHAGNLGLDFQTVAQFLSELSKLEQQAAPTAAAPTSARGGRPVVTPPPAVSAPPSPGASVPPPPAPAVPNPVLMDAQRRGLRALLTGDYAGARSALQSAALDASVPRARFYLACAEAGLSLTEPDAVTRTRLEDQARQDWQAVASNRADFATDLDYISPAIARTLGISR